MTRGYQARVDKHQWLPDIEKAVWLYRYLQAAELLSGAGVREKLTQTFEVIKEIEEELKNAEGKQWLSYQRPGVGNVQRMEAGRQTGNPESDANSRKGWEEAHPTAEDTVKAANVALEKVMAAEKAAGAETPQCGVSIRYPVKSDILEEF